MGPQEVNVQIFERVFPEDNSRLEWHMDGKCVSAGLEDFVELIRDLDETIKSDIVIGSGNDRQISEHSFIRSLDSEQAMDLAAQVQFLEKKSAIRKNKFQFAENFLPED